MNSTKPLARVPFASTNRAIEHKRRRLRQCMYNLMVHGVCEREYKSPDAQAPTMYANMYMYTTIGIGIYYMLGPCPSSHTEHGPWALSNPSLTSSPVPPVVHRCYALSSFFSSPPF